MLIKIAVVFLFVLITISLGFAFYYLLRGSKYSNKLLISLKLRVTIAVLAIVLISIAWFLGGIFPKAPWLYK